MLNQEVRDIVTNALIQHTKLNKCIALKRVIIPNESCFLIGKKKQQQKLRDNFDMRKGFNN